MRHNDIKFPPFTVMLLADITKDSDQAFACYFPGKNSVMVREDGFLLLQTTGQCNGKEFEVLAGRSLVSSLSQVYLFTHAALTSKEQNSIQAKVKRILLRTDLNIDESARSELNQVHINKRLIDLNQRYNTPQNAPAPFVHPELFYLLNVSTVNVGRAINLGALLHSKLKRYIISSRHVNFKHPDLVSWLPENNPMFKLDNPKRLMRLTQLFQDSGAASIRVISNSGRVKTSNWVVYADQPNFDDMRIYIAGNQFRQYLHVSSHDFTTVRELGAVWDKRQGKFYTADDADHHRRFHKWLPKNNPEILVYITENQFKDVKGFDLHSTDHNFYRRTYTDNSRLREILRCQERSILERETRKKELIMLHVGKDDVETVRKLGAVQQRVMRRHEWFISTDHPNYAQLEQWLPMHNPKRYLTDLSVEQCKAIGAFYDVVDKQWFIYEKDYPVTLLKVA